MTNMKSSFFLSVIVLLLLACTSSRDLNQQSRNLSYDREATPFHPEFYVYHTSDDSSTFYLKLDSRELLYARKAPDAPFEARLQIEVSIEKIEGFATIPVDSLSFRVIDQNNDQERRVVYSKQNFKLKEGDYRFDISITDLNRRWEQGHFVEVVKSASFSKEDFLWMDVDRDMPVFTPWLNEGRKLVLRSDRCNGDIAIEKWEAEESLPPPPYTNATPRYPSLPFPNPNPFSFTEDTLISELGMTSLFIMEKGTPRHIWTLPVRNPHFPKVETVEQMMTALRYISGRKEYERIETSNYRKKEIDEFWLDCGGSKDRTRELIRIYYQRVEEANVSFSSLLPGWKTDRGVIHIVFGNPNRIKHTPQSEIWIYGEENNLSSVTFEFIKTGDQLTDNHFVLERNPLFRPDWDRAVTAWRNGRIFQE